MREVTYHIGVLLVQLYIPSAQSLKDKRMILKSLKDRGVQKFHVSFAELDDLDKWQSAVYGLTLIGNDNRSLDQCLQSIVSFIQSFRDLEISDYQISFL